MVSGQRCRARRRCSARPRSRGPDTSTDHGGGGLEYLPGDAPWLRSSRGPVPTVRSGSAGWEAEREDPALPLRDREVELGRIGVDEQATVVSRSTGAGWRRGRCPGSRRYRRRACCRRSPIRHRSRGGSWPRWSGPRPRVFSHQHPPATRMSAQAPSCSWPDAPEAQNPGVAPGSILVQY